MKICSGKEYCAVLCDGWIIRAVEKYPDLFLSFLDVGGEFLLVLIMFHDIYGIFPKGNLQFDIKAHSLWQLRKINFLSQRKCELQNSY